MADVLVHPFEAAGLGLAPFRCIAAYNSGLSGCAYCGTGIKAHYLIRSRDGKQFIVGSDCVAKTLIDVDRTLALDVRKEKARLEAEKREAKREQKWQKIMARVKSALAILAANPSLLTNTPHPNDYFAGIGKTRRDYLVYLLGGGETGKSMACKEIEAAALSSLSNSEETPK